MISVPFGTVISKPSIVTRTPSADSGNRQSLRPGPSEEHRRGWVERAAAALVVLDEFVPEVLDRRHDRADRAVAERAERAAQDVVADVKQLVEVALAALAALERVEHLDDPERALAARRALAAGLVLVELHPPQRGAHDAGRLVEDLQRPGAEHRPGRADRLEVERHVHVLVGEDRRGRPAGRPELQLVARPGRRLPGTAARAASRRAAPHTVRAS